MKFCALSLITFCLLWSNTAAQNRLNVHNIPPLPDPIGVAGPIVGYHRGAVIVAGGANFAKPDAPDLWTLPKKYHTQGWVLPDCDSDTDALVWQQSFRLTKPIGYCSVVSTSVGVLVLGGHDSRGPTKRTFVLIYDPETRTVVENDRIIPDLPLPATEGGATQIGDYVYAFAGNVVIAGKKQPSKIVWRLNLKSIEKDAQDTTQRWERVPDLPEAAPPREHALVAAQHDGFQEQLYIIGGRRFEPGTDTADLNNLKFFRDVWSFESQRYVPEKFDPKTGRYDGQSPWRKHADAMMPLSAGTAVAFGQSHILVLGYADGSIIQKFLAAKKDSGRDDYSWADFDHPGFPKTAYAYHTITDAWTEFGQLPVNQVTTPAVKVNNQIFLVSGEIRPRVRSNQVWVVTVNQQKSVFGTANMLVLIVYLALIVLVGVYFTWKNKNTDDYFRGSKNVHWFVAGCSIYATMLSSITYMAIPAKAFAQDWVYAFGSLLILGVAPIAIYIALPFFRRIDATSAYEYLERRFNGTVRRIGSATFTLFHVFRMGVVMALASLALASVTPMTPAQCVMVMGVLSIIYCTLGGIEAVLWTDTIQTFVLLGGALLCLFFAWQGAGADGFSAAADAGKFHVVNLDLNPAHFTTMTILVVIVGGFGQNLSSYTADQAVVQRYMTTPDINKAARSIWLNGLMAVPSAIIFFGLGTALWMFYRSNPAKLDPTITTDRIMPLFISQELPVGLAGLVVAGIFAAAQSTVSTSMNSGATTIVTDFLKPWKVFGETKKNDGNDRRYLRAAQVITLVMGILGTLTGLLFVNPNIKSLFDEFIGILGIFLGVLAGLFALGATTRRANAFGGLVGAVVALVIMSIIYLGSKQTNLAGINFAEIASRIPLGLANMHGYLYAFTGIVVCYIVGYLASFLVPTHVKPTDGLILWGHSKEQRETGMH